MYSYTFSDKESEQITSKTNALAELEKTFAQIDKKYDLTATVNPEDYQSKLSLERLKFEGKDETKIAEEAKNSLKAFEDTSKQTIESNYQQQKQAVEEDLENLQQNTQEGKNALRGAFEKAKKDASDDAIKRGLARSSIIANKLSSFDSQMLNQFAKMEQDYLSATQKLTAQKNLLEVQRQNALGSFDIAYAVKLTEKINAITQNLSEKEKEVLEYNNKMEQLEKEYEQKMIDSLADAEKQAASTNKDYLEYLSKYGTGRIESVKADEKYTAALDYLNSIPKAQALYELENNNMFRHELKNGYGTLVAQMKNRKE